MNNKSKSSESITPIVYKDENLFGSVKPEKSKWLINVEIYKVIAMKIHVECIIGIHRVRDIWRKYMDNEEDRLALVTQDLALRGKYIVCITFAHTKSSKSTKIQTTHRPNPMKNTPLLADRLLISKTLRIYHPGQNNKGNGIINTSKVYQEFIDFTCL